MDRKNSSINRQYFIHPYFIAGVIPLLFFLLFYFYPLAGIFIKSFFEENTRAPGVFEQVLQSSRMTGIIWFTIWQAAVSTLLTFICALPCAFVMSHYRFKGRRLLQSIATVPFVLPAVVVAAALQACFGRHGFFSVMRIENPLLLIFMAHVFYNFSVMLRIITGFWMSLQGRIREAAQVLGASPFQVFRYITLPLLAPAILGACVLVFIFCFSSFGIILILGGPSYSTIETEIYRQAAHLFNLPVAAFLSIFQIIFTLMLMRGYAAFTKKAGRVSSGGGQARLRNGKFFWEKLSIAGVTGFILFLCAMPLAALAVRSVIYKGRFSLEFYKALFVNRTGSVFYIPPVNSIKYSIIFAVIAVCIALLAGLCAALFVRHSERYVRSGWGGFIDPIFMLPLATSAVTLGFGIIVTLDKPPLNLRTSILLVPVAHALVGFPFVLRAVLPALRGIPENLSQAAAVLGASPLKIFREIDLPLISKSVIAGAVFSFTISMGEFGASVFTARPQYPTIPLAIYRFLGQPGAVNYGQAMAISTILMIVTAAGFLVIEKFSDRGVAGF